MLTFLRLDRTTRTGILVIYGFGIPFLLTDASIPSLVLLVLIAADLIGWPIADRRRKARRAAQIAEVQAERDRLYREHLNDLLTRAMAQTHRPRD